MGVFARALCAVGLMLVVAGAAPGCNAPDKKYSQTELNALQTREFDYPFDVTFDAVVGSLFDLGYTVYSSDKRAGLLSAGQGHGEGAQIKVDQLAPKRTSVRVSTLSGGQTHVNKAKIDEFLNTVDRRLTAGAGQGK
jgi:hypothetical protein